MNKIKPLDSNVDRQEANVSGRAVFLRTLVLFLPAIALAFAVTASILLVREKTDRAVRFSEDRHVVELQVSCVEEKIAGIASDLAILSHETMDAPLWGTDGEIDPDVVASLAQHYLSFSIHRKLYDQIRLLDEQGMEIVRVNFNNGHPTIEPEEDLQNKQGRYYFDDAFVLN